MPVLYRPGQDLLASEAEVLINTVNCRGAMGKGLALAFKERFPAIMPPYLKVCRERSLKPGGLQAIRLDRATGARSPEGDLVVLNFATKDDWRDPSRLEWIDRGLGRLARYLEEKQVRSVAVPMLGAGLGGLDWASVHSLVHAHLAPLAERGLAVLVFGEARPLVQLPEGLGPKAARAVEPAGAATALGPAGPILPITETSGEILGFTGPHAVLGNAHPTPVRWGDAVTPEREFASLEAAFRLAQTLDPAARDAGLRLHDQHAADPQALAAGLRRWSGTAPLRPDWVKARDGVMAELLRAKFAAPAARAALLATGTARLVEVAPQDSYWGVLGQDQPARGLKAGEGRNRLGELLMELRDELARGERPRAAAAAPVALAPDRPDEPLAIAEFKDAHAFCSNMYATPVRWGDALTPARLFANSEVPYQLAKTLDPAQRAEGIRLADRAEAERPGSSGYALKKWSHGGATLRPDWDRVKDGLMLGLVRDKFARNPNLAERLRAVAGRIQEGNHWGDTYWGVALADQPARGLVAGQGQNKLGRILMQVRDELARGELHPFAETASAAPAPPAERVAAPGDTPDLGRIEVVHLKTYQGPAAKLVDISRRGTLAFADGTRLGNPFVMTSVGGRDGSREEVIGKYARWLEGQLAKPGFQPWLAQALDGKAVGCFCAPKACHGHVLAAAATAIVKGRDPVQAIRPFQRLEPGQVLPRLAGPAAAASRAAPVPAQGNLFAAAAAPPASVPTPAPVPTPALVPTPAAGPGPAQAGARIYTGVGARLAAGQPPLMAKMARIGELLAQRGWTLRSGAADGADTAFERGCDAAGGAKEIYLPREGFNGRSAREAGVIAAPVQDAAARAHAARVHPAFDRLDGFVQALHTRNVHQVLGQGLDRPSDLLICWTEEGMVKGGTATAIKLARANQVPVLNLGSMRWRHQPAEAVVAAIEAGQHLDAPVRRAAELER